MLPAQQLLDEFGFVEPVDGLRQGVIIGISNTSDRGNETRVSQSLRVAIGHILTATDGIQDNTVHVRRGKLPQQRRGRDLFQEPQGRNALETKLANTTSGYCRHLSIHQRFL